MNTTTHIDFISSKINELKTAVFHSHSNSVLNLSPTVINTARIDDNGNIWFFVNKPTQKVTEFEKQFPVALNYYKKGTPFFLNVFGVARIVIDPEELTCADMDVSISNGIASDKILLCVKIANVNYYEKETEMSRTWFSKLKKAFAGIFIPEEDAYFTFENSEHFA